MAFITNKCPGTVVVREELITELKGLAKPQRSNDPQVKLKEEVVVWMAQMWEHIESTKGIFEGGCPCHGVRIAMGSRVSHGIKSGTPVRPRQANGLWVEWGSMFEAKQI